jgi:hypothetical protein
MPSEHILRAKIRDLMVSGVLPRVQADGSLVNDSGRAVAGRRQVALGDFTGSCLVCEDPGPQVSYQAPDGRVLYLHLKCDTLWQEERRPRTRP